MITLEKRKTDRLFFRLLSKADANDIFTYCNQKDIVDRVGMRYHESIDVTYQYIEHELRKKETFGLLLKADHQFIGTVSLRKLNENTERDIRMISIIINPLYWGSGYGTEAVKEVIKFAFEDEGVDELLGGYYAFNTRSKKLQERLGFTCFGVERDDVIYNGVTYDAYKCHILKKDYFKIKEVK